MTEFNADLESWVKKLHGSGIMAVLDCKLYSEIDVFWFGKTLKEGYEKLE